MKVSASRIAVAIIAVLVVPAIATVTMEGPSSDLNPARIEAVAAQHAKFTVEQRAAIVQELRSEHHPRWKNLSTTDRIQHVVRVSRRKLRQRASSAAAAPTIAPFVGNQTILLNSTGDFLGLQRQSDCSLTLYDGNYSYINPTVSLQFMQTTPHYEQVLHSQAGLTTTPNVFAGGCAEGPATSGTVSSSVLSFASR